MTVSSFKFQVSDCVRNTASHEDNFQGEKTYTEDDGVAVSTLQCFNCLKFKSLLVFERGVFHRRRGNRYSDEKTLFWIFTTVHQKWSLHSQKS